VRNETDVFLSSDKHEIMRWVSDLNQADFDGQYSIYAEKTPRHVHKIDQILSVIPTAKILVCVRNPLDVISSLIRRGYTLDQSISRYVSDNSAWLSKKSNSNLRYVLYEHLVTSPRVELEKICRFIGVTYEDSMMNFWKTTELYYAVDQTAFANYISRNAGKSLSEFSQDEDTLSRNNNHLMYRNFQIHLPLSDMNGNWKHLSESEINKIVAATEQITRGMYKYVSLESGFITQ